MSKTYSTGDREKVFDKASRIGHNGWVSKSNDKWAASERAMHRAMRLCAGLVSLKYGMTSAGVCDVECASPEDAKRVAALTGGKIAASGKGYAANTVLVKP